MNHVPKFSKFVAKPSRFGFFTSSKPDEHPIPSGNQTWPAGETGIKWRFWDGNTKHPMADRHVRWHQRVGNKDLTSHKTIELAIYKPHKENKKTDTWKDNSVTNPIFLHKAIIKHQ
jgi:hypothetical protein